MTDKVVYFLGAGFSAPLGIPTVKDFLRRAKDLYQADNIKYADFEEVFLTIEELAKISLFFESNQFNIEELLSIIEMRSVIFDDQQQDIKIQKFIRKVIEGCTPEFTPLDHEMPNQIWNSRSFSGTGIWHEYGSFISNLLGIKYQLKSNEIIRTKIGKRDFTYGVITLNYDLIFETIRNNLNSIDLFNFKEPFNLAASINEIGLPLAKLHGSIDIGNIIAPTWNKRVSKEIIHAWKLAHKLLGEANHIRFMGYSLPQNDTYVKYLIKSAIMDSSHLKSIDVLCLDDDGSVERRFDEFIELDKGDTYRFHSGKIESYFITLINAIDVRKKFEIRYDAIENVHNSIFEIPPPI